MTIKLDLGPRCEPAEFIRRWKMRAIVFAVCSSSFAISPTVSAKTTLVFGTYTSDKPSAMVTQIRPTLNGITRLARELDGEEIEFRLQVVKSYTDGVDQIVAGKFDVMRLGPASYVLAKEREPRLRVLAMENNEGRTTFDGIIAVHSDSPVRDVSQLKGRSFAFGSHQSTLGRYFAQLYLMRNGVLAKDLKRFEYLGRHDKVGAAVGAGLFDAGALEETTFRKLVDKGTPIRALLRFPNATRPWIVRAGLDSGIERVLRRAMLALKDAAAFQALRFDGFLPGRDADYELTRQGIQQNARFFADHRHAEQMRQSQR